MTVEFAKEYLAKVLAWPTEDGATAFINLHWTIDKLNQHTGKPIWTGRAVRSVQEAANTLEWALKNNDTRDVYVCMSSQRSAIEKVSRTGHKYMLPARSQENAVALKSLFIDLDAKGTDKNSYASVEEAVAALAEFIGKVGLPRPSAIVKSGGGVHVYWSCDRALTVDEWRPLAYALAEATKKHGLRCDSGCTIDAARVLRVPGTFNHKLDMPRAVTLAGGRTGSDYSVERLARALEPYKVVTPQVTNPLPPRAPLTGVSDLSAGVDMGASAPADLTSVAIECSFIREALATNGAAFSNPLWNLTTLISTFAINGRAEAHRMASAHPGYTKETTDELYDRKERERASKGLGWPSCRTISASGWAGCAGCPHSSQGKSPLNFAVKPAPPPPASSNSATPPSGVGGPLVSDLPSGYERASSNVVHRIVIGADGTATREPISSYPMFDPWLQVHPVYTLNFSTITEVGRQTQIALPLKDASTKDGLKKALWQQGLPLREHETKGAIEFIVSWIEKLQKNKSSVVSSAPFGWSVTKGKVEGFIFGGSMWTPNGDRGAANPDPVIAMQYHPTGERDPWLKAAKMITSQGRPELDAIIASAFAAPLVRFTGEPGILMSAYSQESGIGKTTALKVAQSVWGDPIRAMQGLDDTQNSVFGKIGELRSLPMYWDEIKTDDQRKKFVKMVFQLTNRREKSRMNASASQRLAGTWQTMLVSASNDSIMDEILSQTKQSLAGMYRVFEYEVTPPMGGSKGKGQLDQADASAIAAALDDNYGQIGLEYARYLGVNHQTIASDVASFYKAIGQELKMESEERYWRVMLATLLKGAEYSNTLGFTAIDIPSLKKFLASVVGRMRGEKQRTPVDMRNAMNVSNILAQFLNTNRARHTIQTNIVHTKVGRPPAGTIKILNDMSRVDAIRVHVGVDDKMIRMSSHALTTWLTDEGYSPHMMVRAFEEEFGAKRVQGRIASGTQFAGANEYLIQLDLAGTPHVNFIDEA
jgi:hypothetical protein